MNKLIALVICMGLAFYAGQSTNYSEESNHPKITARVVMGPSQKAIEELIVKVNNALDIAEKKYIKKEAPKPAPIVDICRCNGDKVIVHGDGHTTPCQCSDKPGGCICVRLNPPLPREAEKPAKVVEKPLEAPKTPSPQMMPLMPVVPTIETIFQGIPQ